MSGSDTRHNGTTRAILAALAQGPLTTRELTALLALEHIKGRRLHYAVQWLEKSGRIAKPAGQAQGAWHLLPPPTPTLQQRTRMPAAVRRLATLPAPGGQPSLELGEGERRDCAHYEGCLSRYIERFARLSNYPARCPRACASHQEPHRSIDEHASRRRWAMEVA